MMEAGTLAGGSAERPPPFPDLRADPPGWAELVQRSPRDAFDELVARVAQDIDILTDRATVAIVSAVMEYQAVDPRRRGDLWWSTKRNVQSILVVLGERRHYEPTELAQRQQVGVRALQRGLPLTAVMHAFRVGYVEVWERLRAGADELGPDVAASLLGNAVFVWISLDELSSAVTDAYQRTAALQGLDERRRGLGLVASLRGLPATSAEALRRMHELGIKADGRFLWAAFHATAPAPVAGSTVTVEMPEASLTLVAGDRLGCRDESRLARELQRLGGTHIGIGLVRSGLQGAKLSLLDAELAHRAATEGRPTPVLFRASWSACIVLHFAEQIEAALQPAVEVLRSEDELRHTLEAFLTSRGNLSAAARRLHVHPNTVAYRLDAIRKRSGIDARTSTGAAEAVAAIALIGRGNVGTPGET